VVVFFFAPDTISSQEFQSTNMRLYRYVGPEEIRLRAPEQPRGRPIRSPDDVLLLIAAEQPTLDAEGSCTFTFVVDEHGVLLLASRHDEHVACAGRRPVRAAGEISFEASAPNANKVRVRRVSNQSTGYCPEPESFAEVVAALKRAGLTSPSGYEPACVFRRCEKCRQIALVKEEWYECALCGNSLPTRWNLDEE
jgi:hypothetical protein